MCELCSEEDWGPDEVSAAVDHHHHHSAAAQTRCMSRSFTMQQIYTRRNEHLEVFTTVLAPQGRCWYRAEAEKMVVVHSYRPHWQDELALSAGDVVLVLSKHEEERWFGRLQDGQRGYFPASCVMELSQTSRRPKGLRRSLSLRTPAGDNERSRRGGTGGGGGGVRLDFGQAEREGPFLVQRPQNSLPQPMASHPGIHKSLRLLRKILSKCRKKSACLGANNGAFEGD